MFKKIFLFPSQNLVTVIPLVMILGIIVGYFVDTSFLKNYILVFTFLMLYPTMIGMKIKEAFDLSHKNVVGLAFLLNFIAIPLIAWGLGTLLLKGEPELFAGLAISSLLPTSGMTISWTMLYKGNVPAAVKNTTLSLIIGSLLAPWYLLLMVGKYVPVDVVATFKLIVTVVFIPLILGHFTYKWLLKKYTTEQFNKEIKPFLPAFSTWAMLLIVFTSISMKAKMLVQNPKLLGYGLLILAVFYGINFFLGTIAAKAFLNRPDGLALVFSTVLRNLSLSLGIAATAFGPKAAFIVTLAFILQVQGAAWYGKMINKYGVFKDETAMQTAKA
ncbi:arsenic resistance protein [Carboxydothermus hydrogenoformans]|uniref:Sodium/bile acid symporter family protein n=1 Tax=Carboxydothermus hydrogenoformans (strain ATCC BAA-161 / DSM 6008 / Z-2901) TaxID=246194 RepID=Q3ADS8_CARHZ|nr:bile acid:sodium symporter [Carboxydothermus hydrogenoformans]ABB14067.1 sodium/bile acid symporter family protein [Carboxydothermus hydrogenoformans Z-2901]